MMEGRFSAWERILEDLSDHVNESFALIARKEKVLSPDF